MTSIPAGGMHGASHEVLGRLAVGGMAELYLARTTHDDGSREVVVLKRILPHLAEDPEFVRMFRDEAFLAATLDHPNIVHVHDIGQDGEDYFFTMEYVHGENVRSIIKAAQKVETELPLHHVLQIAFGVCQGLHYAHEQKDEDGSPLRIVHRDVSPTNIIVSTDGEVKIVDFGIAKAAAATHVTQAGMLKGKASYMSPEQCRAQPVDRRSDVFAIGILLFEMTTLTRLFRGDNELAVLHQILTGTVETPSSRVEGPYDPELERIIMKALQSQPDDRYPTAAAMEQDLRRLAQTRGLSPSSEALGEFLRDLCGDKPYPWSEEDDEEGPLAMDGVDVSSTGMPTSTGNFEDEEDTQVNRRAANLRTLVPGGASGWSEEPEAPVDDPDSTGPTNRRLAPVAASAPPRPGAATVGARVEPAPRPGARKPASARGPARAPGRTTATPIGGPRAKPAPAGPAARVNRLKATSPELARTGGTAAPERPDGSSAPKPFRPRSGRTLSGAGGGLAGPLPPRSGRTVPGNARSPVAGGRPSSAPGSRSPTPGPTPSPRPGSAPSQADRTMALSPREAEELARLGKSASPPPPKPAGASERSWPGGQPSTPPAATPSAPPVRRDVDEGARTIALPRYDRTMLAGAGDLPKGPMGWGGNQAQPKPEEDPLTKTQKSPASQISLTSTQKSEAASLTSTQRSPSAAFPSVPSNAPSDLRRPEMRSPAPRPQGSRSLWVPVVVVLLLAVGGAVAWMWRAGIGPFG